MVYLYNVERIYQLDYTSGETKSFAYSFGHFD